MSLLHAEALATLDALEARLKEMEFADARGGTISLYAPLEHCLAATRASIDNWYRAVYQPEHPDDPRCVHGIDRLSCPRCHAALLR